MAECERDVDLFEKYILGDDTLLAGVSPSELAKQLEDNRLVSHDTVIAITHNSPMSPQDQVTTLLKHVHPRIREGGLCFTAFLHVLHSLGKDDLAYKMSEEYYESFQIKDLTKSFPVAAGSTFPNLFSFIETVREVFSNSPVVQEPPGKWYLMQTLLCTTNKY